MAFKIPAMYAFHNLLYVYLTCLIYLTVNDNSVIKPLIVKNIIASA